MMRLKSNSHEFKVLTYVVIAVLVFGAYFLRHYLAIIMFASITAFIFNPVHQFFLRRNRRPGRAAAQTFLVAMLSILIPLGLICIITFWQIHNLIHTLSTNPQVQSGAAAQSILDSINKLLSHFPGSNPISMDDINNFINKTVTKLADGSLDIVRGSVGSFSRFITSVIIYIYIFVNILTHQDVLVDTIKRLNPLGGEVNDMYLAKASLMTNAMAKGQFIIASLQGLESSAVLYLVGFHHLFFFFLIFLSFLSLIPLGAGIVTIPIGIVLILTGNIWQGIVVILNHLLIVTNIDNVIRPKLVPKKASLNSALTILSVFAGVAMFGFLGIIIGPVIMVLIVSTITVYLASNDPKYQANL